MFGFRDFNPQVREVFSWISGIADIDDVIMLCRGAQTDYFGFSFPLRVGDMPRKVGAAQGKETFIIRTPNQRFVGSNLPDEKDWLRLFVSPSIAVWEKRSRKKNILPLRFGLNEEERVQLIEIARTVIRNYVEHSIVPFIDPTSFPRRFMSKTDLDVALWVNGHLRGSVIVGSLGLAEGVAQAAVLACTDARFKPLETRELNELAIEITVMRDLRVTLSPREVSQDEIYSDKGYRLTAGECQGWFLPEVFNVSRFSRLADFLQALAREKAGVTSMENTRIFVFEVEDFISLSHHSPPLSLMGPVIQKSVSPDFLVVAHSAAEWLCRIQEDDGNLPPIIDPTRDISPRVDWARVAFTAWALAEFGLCVERTEYVHAAKRSFVFLKKHIDRRMALAYEPLVLSYFGQLARILKEEQTFSMIISKLLSTPDHVRSDTIMLAQVASCLNTIHPEQTKLLGKELRERFERGLRDQAQMGLAVYAELVHVFERSDSAFSIKVSKWLISMQNKDGSFPNSTGSSFNYSRGAGKIFEVLALDPIGNKEILQKTLQWLATMQYDEGNLFFVAPDKRGRLLGAFRHDDQNPEAWIDAAGHVLLGISRIPNALAIT